jgi:hypothetical protein
MHCTSQVFECRAVSAVAGKYQSPKFGFSNPFLRHFSFSQSRSALKSLSVDAPYILLDPETNSVFFLVVGAGAAHIVPEAALPSSSQPFSHPVPSLKTRSKLSES